MAKFRNVSKVERIVGYGFTAQRKVAPDDVLTVPDDAAASYACQPTIWKPVDAAAETPKEKA